MRLIDADALFKYNGRSISDAVKYGNKDAEQQEWSYSTMMMYEIAYEIDNAPTVDAVPVVHGRWIWNETGKPDWEQFYTCSNCGDIEYWESHYCPNCGAKMDLEVDGDVE